MKGLLWVWMESGARLGEEVDKFRCFWIWEKLQIPQSFIEHMFIKHLFWEWSVSEAGNVILKRQRPLASHLYILSGGDR